jgi:hypothetical protein
MYGDSPAHVNTLNMSRSSSLPLSTQKVLALCGERDLDKFGTDEITSKPMKGGYILGTERMGALQRDCVARTSPPTV